MTNAEHRTQHTRRVIFSTGLLVPGIWYNLQVKVDTAADMFQQKTYIGTL